MDRRGRWPRSLWGKCVELGLAVAVHTGACLGLLSLMERLGIWWRGDGW